MRKDQLKSLCKKLKIPEIDAEAVGKLKKRRPLKTKREELAFHVLHNLGITGVLTQPRCSYFVFCPWRAKMPADFELRSMIITSTKSHFRLSHPLQLALWRMQFLFFSQRGYSPLDASVLLNLRLSQLIFLAPKAASNLSGGSTYSGDTINLPKSKLIENHAQLLMLEESLYLCDAMEEAALEDDPDKIFQLLHSASNQLLPAKETVAAGPGDTPCQCESHIHPFQQVVSYPERVAPTYIVLPLHYTC
jgi:hypothetical protein